MYVIMPRLDAVLAPLSGMKSFGCCAHVCLFAQKQCKAKRVPKSRGEHGHELLSGSNLSCAKAKSKDPLSHLPDDQLEFAVVENNTAICSLCGKQMQESHLYSNMHQKRAMLLGFDQFALSL